MGGCYSCQKINNTCAICFEELLHTKHMTCSDCNSNMHLLCVLQWDAYMKSCPICNKIGTITMTVNNDIEKLYEI